MSCIFTEPGINENQVYRTVHSRSSKSSYIYRARCSRKRAIETHTMTTTMVNYYYYYYIFYNIAEGNEDSLVEDGIVR